MRESVLGESAPLHGRSTLELGLQPMDYRDSAAFVPHYSREEQAIVYGLTGGVPKYLEQFDDSRSLDENITSQFFSNTGYFTEEQIQTLVTADRSNPAAFNTIIYSVAAGHTKYSEIATDTGGGEQYYNQVVKGQLHDCMGPVFEQMARQYLFEHMGNKELPFFAT